MNIRELLIKKSIEAGCPVDLDKLGRNKKELAKILGIDAVNMVDALQQEIKEEPTSKNINILFTDKDEDVFLPIVNGFITTLDGHMFSESMLNQIRGYHRCNDKDLLYKIALVEIQNNFGNVDIINLFIINDYPRYLLEGVINACKLCDIKLTIFDASELW